MRLGGVSPVLFELSYHSAFFCNISFPCKSHNGHDGGPSVTPKFRVDPGVGEWLWISSQQQTNSSHGRSDDFDGMYSGLSACILHLWDAWLNFFSVRVLKTLSVPKQSQRATVIFDSLTVFHARTASILLNCSVTGLRQGITFGHAVQVRHASVQVCPPPSHTLDKSCIQNSNAKKKKKKEIHQDKTRVAAHSGDSWACKTNSWHKLWFRSREYLLVYSHWNRDNLFSSK